MDRWSRLAARDDAHARVTQALHTRHTVAPALTLHPQPTQVRKFAPDADVHALESSSGRSALHKAAYWGHEQLTAVSA